MNKKMIAPMIISSILILYVVFNAVSFLLIPIISVFYATIVAGIASLICITIVCVLLDRIREIKKGELDDISNY